MRVVSRRRRGAAFEVTFEARTTRWYFSNNLVAYRQALESGRFPLDRTFLTPPPTN